MKEIRALRPDEIECRVQQVLKNGVLILLYKDARCDMAVLDETFTPFGWQRHHELINGKEFCSVSIKDDNGEWISKQDCGTESNTEKEKGQTSDAFKRACTNWGVGRELYTKIFIFINAPTQQNEKTKKYELVDKYAKYFVKSISTDNKAKKILNIEITDKNDKVVFTWDNKNPPKYDDINDESDKLKDCSNDKISEIYLNTINDLIKKTNTDIDGILKFNNVTKLENLTVGQGIEVIGVLEKKVKKNAKS